MALSRLSLAQFRVAGHRAVATAIHGCRLQRAPIPARSLRPSRLQVRAVASTHLSAYLQRNGANWGENFDVHDVQASEEGGSFTWRVDLPDDRLRHLQRGQTLESPLFALGRGRHARFQLYPKGDDDCKDESSCSLWLWTDCSTLGPLRLQVGESQRSSGASEFCTLQDALRDGALEVRLTLDSSTEGSDAEAVVTSVEQSLQLTGLERAEWRIFQIRELAKREILHSSPPFRFHHVMLGDMYLELMAGPELCTLFFRCRVPTMKLQVSISVGDAFAKSFVATGKHSHEDDLKNGCFLHVNLDAPGVLNADGSLKVDCELEKLVSIPKGLKDMMPKLDERALWPKRL